MHLDAIILYFDKYYFLSNLEIWKFITCLFKISIYLLYSYLKIFPNYPILYLLIIQIYNFHNQTINLNLKKKASIP